MQGGKLTQAELKKFATKLYILLGLGVLVVWTVFGFYIYNFAWKGGNWGVLSASPGDWGTFGDYVGGLLNPYFSFLAFGGVLITIILQARQLGLASEQSENIRHQSSLEEMQRVQSSVSQRIDEALGVSFEPMASDTPSVGVSRSIHITIALLGTHRLSEPKKEAAERGTWEWEHQAYAKMTKALDIQTIPVRLDFDALAWMLRRYRKAGGSDTVVDFYRYRYGVLVAYLHSLGLIDGDSETFQFFEPVRVAEDIRPT